MSKYEVTFRTEEESHTHKPHLHSRVVDASGYVDAKDKFKVAIKNANLGELWIDGVFLIEN